jgi:hypothetical protein
VHLPDALFPGRFDDESGVMIVLEEGFQAAFRRSGRRRVSELVTETGNQLEVG